MSSKHALWNNDNMPAAMDEQTLLRSTVATQRGAALTRLDADYVVRALTTLVSKGRREAAGNCHVKAANEIATPRLPN